MISVILALLAATAPQAAACQVFDGAVLINDDGEYIGRITNGYDSDSIFNEYGTYGGKYSAASIWNKYGTNGGEYSANSPFNKHTTTPPRIVKNREVIGRLTVNKYVDGAVNPGVLAAVCYDYVLD